MSDIEYLIGDVGGTKADLALYQEKGGKTSLIKEKKFPSKDYPNLKTILKEFLGDKQGNIQKACLGIPGYVSRKEGTVQATNLPWTVDSKVLQKELGIKQVVLINDLEANAYGVQTLCEDEIFVLNKGEVKEGNRAIISAGTGLGEAGIYFDGEGYTPFPCEGGHCDFASRNVLEDELLQYLRKDHTHVSYERVLSGPGLYNIYSFLIDTGKERECKEVLHEIKCGDSPQIISLKGSNGESQACAKALELFVSIYGSEAGNMALKMFAVGGVFIGGGIAPKIIKTIEKGSFLSSFKEKGRFSEVLSKIPLYIVLNDRTALLGALYYVKNKM